ncbi:MAG TPA: hypothetical protein VFJ16_02325 [Longimicrobium sp.]|nr:hypothetical protein [Longimicrobium sp.]
MKKLMLELDALAVDSFATGDAADGRGTVRGHDTRYTEFCGTRTCGYPTYCGCQVVGEDARQQPAKPDEPFE